MAPIQPVYLYISKSRINFLSKKVGGILGALRWHLPPNSAGLSSASDVTLNIAPGKRSFGSFFSEELWTKFIGEDKASKTVIINYKCDVNISGNKHKKSKNNMSAAVTKRRRIMFIDSSESSQSSQD